MIDAINLSVQFSGNYLFENVNFKINKNDKIALVGANGTGKTTLLRLINGEEHPESGKIQKQKKLKIGYLPQEFISLSNSTLFNEAKSALTEINDLTSRENEINEKLSDSKLSDVEKDKFIHLLGEIEHQKEKIDFYSADARIKKILTGLGFSNSDFERNTQEFSGGWQMRIELAKILLGNNDLILLDEPTNHLDIDSLRWIIEFLENYKGSILLVSHDRYFVNRITNKTLEIADNKVTLFNSTYNDYLNFKDERDNQLQAIAKNQQKRIKEIERFIERFRYKNTKARQVQSRLKLLEKMERVEFYEEESKIEIKFPEPPRGGAIPVELVQISKSYGSNNVFHNLDLKIERGEKIAFVGPNGAGKTTLAKIIAGELKFESGDLKLGHNTLISYYAQEVTESLNLENDILDTLMETSDEYTPGQLRNLLGSFLFSNDDIFKKIKVLSGGEKSRVALAKILLIKANLIVLDEPTNHLDYSSKNILQSALVNYPGTLIIVSHDVDFLKPIVNKIYEVRNKKTKCYHGGIDYYLEKIDKDSLENIQVINKKRVDQSSVRKDLKRIEAEKRQTKYKLTKEIILNIKEIEKNIADFESHKLLIEEELSNEEVFSNPQLSKDKNLEYDKIKNKIEESYSEWTKLTEKLEEIEKSFEN
ncbi:ABC-F family ATP-binding cassette domain-containing protein [Bacteroidota bacterium]